jgi:hypothetical protein
MARRIELKNVTLPNGTGPPVPFSYGEILVEILRYGRRGEGLVLDEVIRATEALKPIYAAIAEGADHVVLTDEQWHTLRNKAETFPYLIADEVVARFGLMIREAQEIT